MSLHRSSPIWLSSEGFYTTNVIEGFNSQLRKEGRQEQNGIPTDDILFKLFYLTNEGHNGEMD